MSVSPVLFTPVALFGPLYVFLLIRRMQLRRTRRRQESEGEIETPPFAPAQPAACSRLLQRFTLPEQAYLNSQRKLLLWLYGIMAYTSLVSLAETLLPGAINRYGLQQSLPERVWYSYLSGFWSAGIFLCLFSLIAALLAIISFVGSSSVVLRTRPVPLRVLFWGLVGGMYLALLAGIATGALASGLLLLLVYGPVWKHLFDAAPIVVPNAMHLHAAVRVRGLPGAMYMTPEQSRHLILSLQSSAPRLALSLIAQCSLVFSLAVAAFALPRRLLGNIAVRMMLVTPVIVLAQIAPDLSPHLAHVTRSLFLSSHLGHPPPYAAFAFPIALSFLLLFLARQATLRYEL
jgi:hypothetical protein